MSDEQIRELMRRAQADPSNLQLLRRLSSLQTRAASQLPTRQEVFERLLSFSQSSEAWPVDIFEAELRKYRLQFGVKSNLNSSRMATLIQSVFMGKDNRGWDIKDDIDDWKFTLKYTLAALVGRLFAHHHGWTYSGVIADSLAPRNIHRDGKTLYFESKYWGQAFKAWGRRHGGNIKVSTKHHLDLVSQSEPGHRLLSWIVPFAASPSGGSKEVDARTLHPWSTRAYDEFTKTGGGILIPNDFVPEIAFELHKIVKKKYTAQPSVQGIAWIEAGKPGEKKAAKKTATRPSRPRPGTPAPAPSSSEDVFLPQPSMGGDILIHHSAEHGTVITGDTKTYKDEIKAVKKPKFRWSRKLGAWYVGRSRGVEGNAGYDWAALAEVFQDAGAKVELEFPGVEEFLAAAPASIHEDQPAPGTPAPAPAPSEMAEFKERVAATARKGAANEAHMARAAASALTFPPLYTDPNEPIHHASHYFVPGKYQGNMIEWAKWEKRYNKSVNKSVLDILGSSAPPPKRVRFLAAALAERGLPAKDAYKVETAGARMRAAEYAESYEEAYRAAAMDALVHRRHNDPSFAAPAPARGPYGQPAHTPPSLVKDSVLAGRVQTIIGYDSRNAGRVYDSLEIGDIWLQDDKNPAKAEPWKLIEKKRKDEYTFELLKDVRTGLKKGTQRYMSRMGFQHSATSKVNAGNQHIIKASGADIPKPSPHKPGDRVYKLTKKNEWWVRGFASEKSNPVPFKTKREALAWANRNEAAVRARELHGSDPDAVETAVKLKLAGKPLRKPTKEKLSKAVKRASKTPPGGWTEADRVGPPINYEKERLVDKPYDKLVLGDFIVLKSGQYAYVIGFSRGSYKAAQSPKVAIWDPKAGIFRHYVNGGQIVKRKDYRGPLTTYQKNTNKAMFAAKLPPFMKDNGTRHAIEVGRGGPLSKMESEFAGKPFVPIAKPKTASMFSEESTYNRVKNEQAQAIAAAAQYGIPASRALDVLRQTSAAIEDFEAARAELDAMEAADREAIRLGDISKQKRDEGEILRRRRLKARHKADVALVGCTKSKLKKPMAAADLYTASRTFRLRRAYVEAKKLTWGILSAEHGLLGAPYSTIITPYDTAMKDVKRDKEALEDWRDQVTHQIKLWLPPKDGLVIVAVHAGKDYLEAIKPLEKLFPVKFFGVFEGAGKSQGEQEAWYKSQLEEMGAEIPTSKTWADGPKPKQVAAAYDNDYDAAQEVAQAFVNFGAAHQAGLWKLLGEPKGSAKSVRAIGVIYNPRAKINELVIAAKGSDALIKRLDARHGRPKTIPRMAAALDDDWVAYQLPQPNETWAAIKAALLDESQWSKLAPKKATASQKRKLKKAKRPSQAQKWMLSPKRTWEHDISAKRARLKAERAIKSLQKRIKAAKSEAKKADLGEAITANRAIIDAYNVYLDPNKTPVDVASWAAHRKGARPSKRATYQPMLPSGNRPKVQRGDDRFVVSQLASALALGVLTDYSVLNKMKARETPPPPILKEEAKQPLVKRYACTTGEPGSNIPSWARNQCHGLLYDSEGRRYTYEIDVLPIEQIITSHDDQFSPVPLFPQELQARDRSSAENQLEVKKIARELDAERLLQVGPTATEGTPIIWAAPLPGGGKGMVALAGNGRTMAFRQAPAEIQAKYLDLVHYLTGRRGVLVRRIMRVDKQGALKFAAASQESAGAAQTPLEKSRGLSRSIGIKTFAELPHIDTSHLRGSPLGDEEKRFSKFEVANKSLRARAFPTGEAAQWRARAERYALIFLSLLPEDAKNAIEDMGPAAEAVLVGMSPYLGEMGSRWAKGDFSQVGPYLNVTPSLQRIAPLMSKYKGWSPSRVFADLSTRFSQPTLKGFEEADPLAGLDFVDVAWLLGILRAAATTNPEKRGAALGYKLVKAAEEELIDIQQAMFGFEPDVRKFISRVFASKKGADAKVAKESEELMAIIEDAMRHRKNPCVPCMAFNPKRNPGSDVACDMNCISASSPRKHCTCRYCGGTRHGALMGRKGSTMKYRKNPILMVGNPKKKGYR